MRPAVWTCPWARRPPSPAVRWPRWPPCPAPQCSAGRAAWRLWPNWPTSSASPKPMAADPARSARSATCCPTSSSRPSRSKPASRYPPGSRTMCRTCCCRGRSFLAARRPSPSSRRSVGLVFDITFDPGACGAYITAPTIGAVARCGCTMWWGAGRKGATARRPGCGCGAVARARARASNNARRGCEHRGAAPLGEVVCVCAPGWVSEWVRG
eukprot:scaffold20938_cov116-Isochrysis_galbana.AAC.3